MADEAAAAAAAALEKQRLEQEIAELEQQIAQQTHHLQQGLSALPVAAKPAASLDEQHQHQQQHHVSSPSPSQPVHLLHHEPPSLSNATAATAATATTTTTAATDIDMVAVPGSSNAGDGPESAHEIQQRRLEKERQVEEQFLELQARLSKRAAERIEVDRVRVQYQKQLEEERTATTKAKRKVIQLERETLVLRKRLTDAIERANSLQSESTRQLQQQPALLKHLGQVQHERDLLAAERAKWLRDSEHWENDRRAWDVERLREQQLRAELEQANQRLLDQLFELNSKVTTGALTISELKEHLRQERRKLEQLENRSGSATITTLQREIAELKELLSRDAPAASGLPPMAQQHHQSHTQPSPHHHASMLQTPPPPALQQYLSPMSADRPAPSPLATHPHQSSPFQPYQPPSSPAAATTTTTSGEHPQQQQQQQQHSPQQQQQQQQQQREPTAAAPPSPAPAPAPAATATPTDASQAPPIIDQQNAFQILLVAQQQQQEEQNRLVAQQMQQLQAQFQTEIGALTARLAEEQNNRQQLLAEQERLREAARADREAQEAAAAALRAQLDQEVEQRKQLEETYERELLAVRERYQSYVTSQIAQQDEPTSSDLENDLKRVYTPVANDEVDEVIAHVIRYGLHEGLELLPPNFARITRGRYRFGTKTIHISVQNGEPKVRVGGGYVSFKEYVKQHGKLECLKIGKSALSDSDNDDDSVVRELLRPATNAKGYSPRP